MKINICYDIKNIPHGGANQFLKAVKKQFIQKEVYCENAILADIVLFNSHHNIDDLIKIKNSFPKIIPKYHRGEDRSEYRVAQVCPS